MFESILNFLSTGLGNDSKILGFINGITNSIGIENIHGIELTLAIIIWIAFIFGITFGRYKTIKGKSKHIKTYADFIGEYSLKIFFILFIGSALIFYVLLYGLGIEGALNFITWFGDNGHSGINIIFGYDTESTMFQYYNIGRYLTFIIIFTFAAYNWFMHYTVGEIQKLDGSLTKHYVYAKQSIIALIIISIVAFSVIPDILINKIMKIGGTDTYTISDNE